jgi:hypothetical protein
LAELRLADSPPPDQRRRALRDALGSLVPGWRPLAENVLGADARIDWVGRDGQGRCTIALVGHAGGDLSLVAEGLAQRAWVAARVGDWAQLAPDAGLQVAGEVVAVLLAPQFRPAAVAAARAGGGAGLRLATLRFVENGTGIATLIEAIDEAGPHREGGAREAAAGFRSGLSAAELDLTPEERAEFEDRNRS